MSRFFLGSLGALAVVLTLTPDASAWWHGRWRARYYAAYYPAYYPTYYSAGYPVYYSYSCAAPVYVVSMPVCGVAVPSAEARLYAKPMPAPASAAPATPAPATPSPAPAAPLPSRKPQVSESKSYYSAYPVTARDSNGIDPTRCVVGFWNYSDRDQTLLIDGQSRTLPRGRGLTLELPREFVWSVAGREPQVERVAAAESTIEIAIYR